mmetsp:Transcript_16105/g.46594  ORF Transcript_16105/g.46594 Transcript_16105/m.46594 type:complete len:309 (+) Transcript_16105:154-1080(+)
MHHRCHIPNHHAPAHLHNRGFRVSARNHQTTVPLLLGRRHVLVVRGRKRHYVAAPSQRLPPPLPVVPYGHDKEHNAVHHCQQSEGPEAHVDLRLGIVDLCLVDLGALRVIWRRRQAPPAAGADAELLPRVPACRRLYRLQEEVHPHFALRALLDADADARPEDRGLDIKHCRVLIEHVHIPLGDLRGCARAHERPHHNLQVVDLQRTRDPHLRRSLRVFIAAWAFFHCDAVRRRARHLERRYDQVATATALWLQGDVVGVLVPDCDRHGDVDPGQVARAERRGGAAARWRRRLGAAAEAAGEGRSRGG